VSGVDWESSATNETQNTSAKLIRSEQTMKFCQKMRYIADYLRSVNLCDYDVIIVHVTVVSTKLKLTRCIFSRVSTATNLHFGQSRLNSKVRKTIPSWNDFVLDAKTINQSINQFIINCAQ